MTRSRTAAHRALLLAPLLLALSACGGADTSPATEPTAGPTSDATDAAAGGAAGACLEGATECADIPTGTGGVTSGPDGSVAVADAVSTPIDGPFVVSGFWVADGTGEADGLLCQALAESFPPQCGGASLPVDLGGTSVEGPTQTEGEVTWSEEPISIDGQIVDGVFVAASR